uniref:Uncharacterized protein n=1 Tax=Arundo donax TaxID=35708 RepID=A0A0A9BVL1_ARUDO
MKRHAAKARRHLCDAGNWPPERSPEFAPTHDGKFAVHRPWARASVTTLTYARNA